MTKEQYERECYNIRFKNKRTENMEYLSVEVKRNLRDKYDSQEVRRRALEAIEEMYHESQQRNGINVTRAINK